MRSQSTVSAATECYLRKPGIFNTISSVSNSKISTTVLSARSKDRFEHWVGEREICSTHSPVRQKQQHLLMLLELHNQAAADGCFLRNVITGNQLWLYAYDPEQEAQSSQRKSPGSPHAK